MTDVTVSLNRDGLNTVTADERTVTVTRALSIALENHGKPTHVHLHLDDDLATIGTIEDPHWFIPKGEWREVELQVSEAATGNGRLRIEAGYGQEQERIDVDVTAPADAEPEPVEPSPTAATEPEAEPPTEPGNQTDRAALLSDLDKEALRDPFVLGASAIFVFLLVGFLAVAPLAAFGTVLGAVLGVVAVWGYQREAEETDAEPT